MRFFIAVVLAVVALVASGFAWVQSPLKLEATVVDIHIDAGSSAREVAHQVAGSGVDVSEDLLYAWFRLSGKSRQIRAGSYELTTGITPKTLLEKFVRGDQALRSVTILEGWTFRQARQALAKADTTGRPGSVRKVPTTAPTTIATSQALPATASVQRQASSIHSR